jgi:hypothetical protein
MPLPLLYELDRKSFGVLRFPREVGKTVIDLKPIERALAQVLDVNIEARRERLFGPKVHRFVFQGEMIALRVLDNGDAVLDLSLVDDEARETVMELIRHAEVFERI